MRMNYETSLVGKKVIFAPYRPEHVQNYHEWMKDPFLLEMTGSEPLSLEEEYQMQESWKDDNDKLTFILLTKKEQQQEEDGNGSSTKEEEEEEGERYSTTTSNNDHVSNDFINQSLDTMIGDINLFLSDEEEEDDDDNEDEDYNQNNNSTETKQKESKSIAETTSTTAAGKEEEGTKIKYKQAEIDIMIAKQPYRSKGIGTEAVSILMIYAAQQLNIRRFFVKIKIENKASRDLFEKRLGFVECQFVQCFGEYEFEFRCESPRDVKTTLMNKRMKIDDDGSSGEIEFLEQHVPI